MLDKLGFIIAKLFSGIIGFVSFFLLLTPMQKDITNDDSSTLIILVDLVTGLGALYCSYKIAIDLSNIVFQKLRAIS